MTSWPADYEGAWTLAGPVTRSGVGLHSGESVSVTLLPCDRAGFWVSWHDCSADSELVQLHPSQVRDSPLCTTLEFGAGRRLKTVEHLLAALAGTGITHAEIRASGVEVPLLDGSAQGWVEAIGEVGLSPASTARPPRPHLDQPLVRHRGSSVITAVPAEHFSLVGVIDFPQGAIGRQQLSLTLTPELFVKEIAPARTFGFRDQVEQLREAGLIQGGALDNALVCDGDHWLNPPLRFDDEPVRHKLLDLIGDLALVGFPTAQVLVYRGSHGLHTDLASALADSPHSPS
ncbi:MAG: UDP-3-O-[3-hydroxymyristoyl] N-acetylglucosamine deacetylase [Synechococcus sp. TMED187]|jgi:UDP-3-O-[3-hydroxymyristoyl] N-acetylglucosamine deacetylase|uniref:UDP-3-O-acyl-N-acetylglucosamine deacetylase n=1 Tax=Synechococcus sp. MIT S9451 TaxID=3082543 RepID=UPI000B74A8AF|nr:UDP-3-O-[3-hydroxymyristoyl] N-acetylglucosamine deacetylase [Synechococcus sp. NAT40]OUW46755.1 MAG: UDP-3-O-[3-hydroxymyristoyl] N-acetylglucosamine deacetylase [Synechococcus sp. TMED187]RZO14239.1 MAG: UDP-3-O-acyl-N-acetylglucosamine deacetylase [Synechococcus sp. MED-G135]